MMPFSTEPFFNPKLGIWVKFNRLGEAFRKEAEPTVPQGRHDRWKVSSDSDARWKPLHDGYVVDHDPIMGKALDGPPLKKRGSYVYRVAKLLAPIPSSGPVEEQERLRLEHWKMVRALSILSPSELHEMDMQFSTGPRSEQERYRETSIRSVQKNFSEHESRFPHSASPAWKEGDKYPVKAGRHGGEDKERELKEWQHLSGEHDEPGDANQLEPMRISRIAPLKIDGEQVLPEYAEAYHPKFGQILLLRPHHEDGTVGDWEAFDGLSVTDENQIVTDSTRSELLLKHNLLAPVQDVLDHLNTMSPPDLASMRGDAHEIFGGGGGAKTVGAGPLTGIDRFNSERPLIPHIPTIRITSDNKNLIDTELGKWGEIAKLNAESPNITNLKSLLGDPIALYAALSHLQELDISQFADIYKNFTNQNFFSIGHPDLHGVNSEALHKALDNRNPRYKTGEDNKQLVIDRGEAHEITGYSPPLLPNRLKVRYEAMTNDEKTLLRNHYGDLYDRPAAYLQHTKNGRSIYNSQREISAREIADMESRDKNEMIWTHANFRQLNKEEASKLITETGEFKVADDSALSGVKISTIHNGYDQFRPFLSSDQQKFMDQVDRSDIAKHILGIDVDGDQLVHERAIDALLGHRWVPTQEDWEEYDRTGNLGVFHVNDAFRLRLGGSLTLGPKDKDGNFTLNISYSDPEKLGLEEVGVNYPLTAGEEVTSPLTDFPPEIADSKSTSYAGNLDSLFRPSVKDQFVRDGILPSKYASSEAVKKRPGAPEPPEHGSPECLERAAFVYTLVSEYPPSEQINQVFRGFDNDSPSYEYDIDPASPDAIKIASEYTEGLDPEIREANGNIYNIIINQVNKKYGNGINPFSFLDKALIPEDVQALNPSPPLSYKGRVITVVTMPDGSRQPFYRRTGGGNEDIGSDTEPGIWMPFQGFLASGLMIKPDAFEKGYEAGTKMARYGNAENHAMSQRLTRAFEEMMLFPDQGRGLRINGILQGIGGNAINFKPNDKGGEDAIVDPRFSEAQQKVLYGDGGTTELEGRELLISLNKHLAEEGHAQASEVLGYNFSVKEYPVGEKITDWKVRDTETSSSQPSGDATADATAGDPDAPAYLYGNLSVNKIMSDLEATPAVRAYRKQLQDKQASEVLQNAPINIRATAWRQRLAGIEERMKHLTTQGDAHALTRELMRAAIVEHPDMIRIDRDGASKFRQLSRQLVEGGADLYSIDKELQDHRNTVNDMQGTIDSIKEYQQSLSASGLLPDPRKIPVDEWDEAQKEAYDRYTTLQNGLIDLNEKKIRYTYGSDEHLAELYNPKFGMAEVYDNMNNTRITADAQQKLNNYNRLKDGTNVVASALHSGLEAFKESRLLGNSQVASMLQAVASTIGEGTGFGGDKIRGLDVTKPLDQQASESGGWQKWLKLPLPESIGGVGIPAALRPQTVEAWRRKQAGKQGEVYTPEPTAEDPEYAAALGRTEGKITVEQPKYKEDTEAPQNIVPPQSTTSDDNPAPEDTAGTPTQDTQLEDVGNEPKSKPIDPDEPIARLSSMGAPAPRATQAELDARTRKNQ